MNKSSAIIRIIIWSIVALLLTQILCSALGGGTSFFANRFHFNFGFHSLRYQNESDYSVGDFTCNAEIRAIKIYWIGGNINIESYDGSDIAVSENASGSIRRKDCLRYLVKDDTLIIRARKSGFYFGSGVKYRKNLTVRLPESLSQNLSQINIDSVSAQINCAGIKCEKFSFDSVSGDVTLSDSVVGEIKADSVSGSFHCDSVCAESVSMDTLSGKCIFDGSVKYAEFDSMSGRIEVTSSVFLEEIDVDTVSGNAYFTMPCGNGFSADFDSVSGDFDCNTSVSAKKGRYTYGDGSADYRFESVSGNVTLQLIEKTEK